MNASSHFHRATRITPALARLFSTLAILCSLSIHGQEPAGSAPATNAVPAHAATATATNAPLSPGIADLLKLADAEVSPLVIKTFIECSPAALQPTSADLIALKTHGVSDEIMTLLLQRGAQTRVATAQGKADAEHRAQAVKRLAAGGFDPEGYDYFQYYHLRTRTLATVAQQLGPYGYTALPPGYGFAGTYGYGPRFGYPGRYGLGGFYR
jgi:hypothetical protein